MVDDPVERLRSDIADLRVEIRVLGLDTTTIKVKLDNIEKDVDALNNKTLTKFVTLERYATVEKVVYGTVALILMSFLGAIITLVVRGA